MKCGARLDPATEQPQNSSPQKQTNPTPPAPHQEKQAALRSAVPDQPPEVLQDDLASILPKPGISPFAVACLLCGIYFALSWLPSIFYSFSFLKNATLLGRMVSIFGGLSSYGLNSYAFAAALLTGPVAWREIKAGRSRIKGKIYVITGLSLIGVMFLGKLFGIIR